MDFKAEIASLAAKAALECFPGAAVDEASLSGMLETPPDPAMGDFAFPEPLELGDRIVFDDMIHYTMVKTTFFNGVAHPAIGVIHADGNFEMLAQPGDYASYKAKLG